LGLLSTENFLLLSQEPPCRCGEGDVETKGLGAEEYFDMFYLNSRKGLKSLATQLAN
jgi:hypothetical protein